MDEQTARALAKEIVQKMLEPMLFAQSPKKYPPLNIIDLMYVGAYFTRSMVQFGFDPLEDEVYSLFEKFPPDPHRVEDYLFRRIMAGKEDANQIIRATLKISRATKGPGSYRRVFITLFKEAVPGGKPGRTTKIRLHELPKLAALSDDLLPAVSKFLALRKLFSRTVPESLKFLLPDFPDQVEYLQHNQDALVKLLQEKRLLRGAKTDKSRSRLIADAMAGCNFELKPSYAIRKAKEARRNLKVRANEKTQN